jgi:hypothetical protein
MVDLNALRPEDLKALGPDAITEVATRMLAQLAAQTKQIEQQQALVERRERKSNSTPISSASPSSLRATRTGSSSPASNA